MNPEPLLVQVRQLKAKGVKTVDIDRLEAALEEASTLLADNKEWQLKAADLKHQSRLAGYGERRETVRTLLNAAFTFAGATLKSALLVNGGAAVAILAYLGNSQGKEQAELSLALLNYTLGVLLAAMATGASYLSQFNYSYSRTKKGNSYRNAAIMLIVATYLAFLGGSLTAFFAFAR